MKISIITPLYNKAPYIEETIRSVLAQTHRDWEMIIIDNGSTDGGDELVARQLKALSLQYSIEIQDEKAANCQLPTEHLTSSDTLSSTLNLPLSASLPSPIAQLPYPTSDIPSPISHLRLLKYAAVKGPGAARNEGLRHASGDWVLFLDADDLIEPDYLEARISVLQSRPDAEIIAGPWKEFDAQDQERNMTKRYPVGFMDQKGLYESSFCFTPWILHAALIASRCFVQKGGWNEALDDLPSEDCAFWFTQVFDSQIVWQENDGALYRKFTETSRDDITGDSRKSFDACRGNIRMNEKYLTDRGHRVSARQAATAVRVYENLLSKTGGNAPQNLISDIYREIQYWLDRTSLFDLKMVFYRLRHFLRRGMA
ncbi:glycosyltransferase family 2 protein [Oscillatoria amoena NRMC-F 0135]|nr:glycosyltransferase family 2 protein [Oscillatoria laete-virens]MDL5047205.1 glycosyltransferase family 2 protein [Oscillatoria amoena NRMC-F 0135]MDL5055463.1 glycosyltransferase family 2 protein [Oscillatoria laete-virens NRMC-F 0139]